MGPPKADCSPDMAREGTFPHFEDAAGRSVVVAETRRVAGRAADADDLELLVYLLSFLRLVRGENDSQC